jgi:hypothetical protein
MKDGFLKRLHKKTKKGARGWPGGARRDARLEARGRRRAHDPRIAEEMLAFMTRHSVLSIAMTNGIIESSGGRTRKASTTRAGGARSASSGRDATASRVSVCTEALT